MNIINTQVRHLARHIDWRPCPLDLVAHHRDLGWEVRELVDKAEADAEIATLRAQLGNALTRERGLEYQLAEALLVARAASSPVAWAAESNVGDGMRSIVKISILESEIDRFVGASQAEYAGCERQKIALFRQDATPFPQGGAVPGWQWVPKELTEEMHAAAVRTILHCTGNDDFPPRVYAAILAAAPQPPAAPTFDFVAHLAHQAEWSERTFGPGPRTAGVCDHIRKELTEIEADPLDLKEWIDVIILALDGAWRCGGSPQQIIDGIIAKQIKNEGRVWPDWRTADPNKAIEHDRSHDASPTSSETHQNLFRFYHVENLTDLVDAQAGHIESLQSRLAPLPDLQPRRTREG